MVCLHNMISWLGIINDHILKQLIFGGLSSTRWKNFSDMTRLGTTEKERGSSVSDTILTRRFDYWSQCQHSFGNVRSQQMFWLPDLKINKHFEGS